MKRAFRFGDLNKYGIYGVIKLIALAAYLMFNVFSSTTVNFRNMDAFNFNRVMRIVLQCSMLLFILVDLIVCKKRPNLFLLVCAFIVVLSALLAKKMPGNYDSHLVFLVAFIYIFSEFKFEDVIKYALYGMVISVLLVVGSTLLKMALKIDMGGIEDWTFGRGEGVVRHSLGFTYCTSLTNNTMYMLMMRCCQKRFKLSIVEIVAEFLGVVGIYLLTDTRTGFLICVFLIVIAVLVKTPLKNIKIDKLFRKNSVCMLLAIIPILCLLGSFVLTVCYSEDSALLVKLNGMLSDRLRLQNVAFNAYKPTAFGEIIPWNGWGGYGYTVTPSEDFVYNYVDNSYVRTYFDYGIIGLAMCMTILVVEIYKAASDRNYSLVLMLILCSLIGCIDPWLFSSQLNIFIICIGAMCVDKSVKCLAKSVAAENGEIGKSVVSVIVTYNRKELLKESIEAYLKQSYKDFKLLVVDNASTDGTEQAIKDYIDSGAVLYYNTGNNLGGAGGFSYGIKKAVEIGVDYIHIADDDCIVNEDTITKLVEFAHDKNDDFGYLSSAVVWTDGSPCKMNVQRRSLSKDVKDIFAVGQKIKLASFVSLFLNRKAVEEVGLPFADFFIWGDDWEYTSRLSKNYDCYLVGNSVVTHKCKENIGVDIVNASAERLERSFYCYRNEGYFYRKCGIRGVLYYNSKVFFHVLKVLFKRCDLKGKRLGIIKKGYFAHFTFKPKLEYAFGISSKLKVMEIFAEPLSYGGQEAFILNMYESFSDERISYTFVTPFGCDNQKLVELTQANGDEIIACDNTFSSLLRKHYIVSSLKNVLKENHVDVIHVHSGSIFALLNVAKIAKKAGVKKVIVHSHCAGTENIKHKIIKSISDRSIEKYADVYLACAEAAAKWKFPKSIIDSGNYAVINNGINLERFSFKSEIREEYRKMLGVNNTVICQVGRFSEQKNYPFSIDLLENLNKKGFDFTAIFIGDGELKSAMLKKIEKAGLKDKVKVFEKRSDVDSILMASDIFILPSLYEGLSVALLESQASGLVSLYSDSITDEIKVTDIAMPLPLDVEVWAKQIQNIKLGACEREKYSELVSESGYDCNSSAKKLESIYFEF